MNIYVVSTVWDREGSTVIGAATDREGCQAIADRTGAESAWNEGWAPWEERVDPGEGACTWERVALMPDGRVHPSLSQEIVCVPLAGMVDTGALSAGLAKAVRAEAMMMPVTYEVPIAMTEPVIPDLGATVFDRMREAIKLISTFPQPTGPLRVGKGAAWDWVQRTLDGMAPYPADRPLPDSIAARVAGVDIVLDPELPPNMMKLGDRTFVVHHNSVISLDESLAQYLTTELD